MNTVPLEQLGFDAFAKLVKTNLRVWIDAQASVELELAEITPPRVTSTGGAHSRKYENFTLEFLGPAEPVLPQRIYCFDSAPIGRFELFIVPVGRDANGTRYQAAFNRLVKSG
jgi:hypothetical protein